MRSSHYPAGCSVSDVSRAAEPAPAPPTFAAWAADADYADVVKVFDAYHERMDYVIEAVLTDCSKLSPETCKRLMLRWADRLQETFEDQVKKGRVTL
jgi:hypothetical protein